MSTQRADKWTIILPEGIVATLERDSGGDDMPWYGVRVRRGPRWDDVASEFAREMELLNSGLMTEWEVLWQSLRDRGLRLRLSDGGEVDEFAVHVDGERGRLRY